MSALSAEERGDMVDALMPEAAGLVVDVHEGSADDVMTRLRGLDRHELEALAVVLAGLVDPDRSIAQALAWVTFDEHGRPLETVRTRSKRRIRDAVPRALRRGQGVDWVVVERALVPGACVLLNRDERRAAIDVGIRRGMDYDDLAERLGMQRDAVMQSWVRSKERARAERRYVPPVPVGQIRHAA